MQYTIDIDPVILEKAQQCAEENGFDLNEYIIEKLEEFGYLSDLNYAMSYIESRKSVSYTHLTLPTSDLV